MACSLNPFPSLPRYSGPFAVGSSDVEIPIKELGATLIAPDPKITTIQFRIYYPCEPNTGSGQSVKWLPDPVRHYNSGMAQFLGLEPRLANAFSCLPGPLHFTSLPVLRDAAVKSPAGTAETWPVFIFSHGLGGTRTMYSHIVGSVASYGYVAIAIEHRDGSAATAVINSADPKTSSPLVIPYSPYPFERSEAVEKARNLQFQIRLWELALLFEGLTKIGAGDKLTNILQSDEGLQLKSFKNIIDVRTPGEVSFCGHSFGAATVVQFVKCIFYHHDPSTAEGNVSLFDSVPSDHLAGQITANTQVILLDLWCPPLETASLKYLYNKPMPCYTVSEDISPGMLAIFSEFFRNWGPNLVSSLRLLLKDPASDGPGEISSGSRFTAFFVQSSAHLSQSDIGVLFPMLTKHLMQAPDPAKILDLNVAAIIQYLRRSVTKPGDKLEEQDMLLPKTPIPRWLPLDLGDKTLFS